MTKAYIISNFSMIAESLILAIENEHAAKKIPELFKIYGIDYPSYIASEGNASNLMAMLEKASKYSESITKMVWQDKVKDLNAVENLYLKLKKEDAQLAQALIGADYIPVVLPELDIAFWSEKIQGNILKDSSDPLPAVSLFKDPQIDPRKENMAIDLLFSTSGWEPILSPND